MKKISILALLLLLATLCFGQAPEAALYNSNSDVYAGFVVTFPDYGPKWNSYSFKGGEVAYTRHLGTHWGVIASGTVVHGNAFVFTATQYSDNRRREIQCLDWPDSPICYGTGWLCPSILHRGHQWPIWELHHPPLAPGSTDIEDGLSLSRWNRWRPPTDPPHLLARRSMGCSAAALGKQWLPL